MGQCQLTFRAMCRSLNILASNDDYRTGYRNVQNYCLQVYSSYYPSTQVTLLHYYTTRGFNLVILASTLDFLFYVVFLFLFFNLIFFLRSNG